jgi:rhamnulose-1-phosphate aldolase
MKTTRLVVWSQHGLGGMGNTLDEAFGLIETVEKAAEVYMKIAGLPRINTISDEIMQGLAERYGVTPKEGYLD